MSSPLLTLVDFYPRPLRGGRPSAVQGDNRPKTFLSTPSARRATQTLSIEDTQLFIFLSTPSARRATNAIADVLLCLDISIHALCEEGDISSRRCLRCLSKFLSTPSARRATCMWTSAARPTRYFYPRPLRGGRLTWLCQVHSNTVDFYPRPLRGGRRLLGGGTVEVISDFYPRPLRGGRQLRVQRRAGTEKFLSTPSARRATWR